MKHLKYLLMAALVAMPLTACDEDDGPIVEPTPTGTITGTVSAEGAGLSGVSVTMVGATTLSATTGADGAFTFTNVEAGSYGVAIDASNHPGVSFSVTSKTTSITSQGQTSTVDFSGSYIRTAALLGSVTASGAPLAGVSVAVTGGPDNVTNNSVTNAGGEFSATGLRAGTYSVTISNLPTGVTFTATTQSITLDTGESKTANFPGQAVQLATISGGVTVDNVGIAGVAVALSGGATAATETGPGGAFSFTNLTPGAYTVTITPPANTTFEVESKDLTVNAGETGVVNFAGVGPKVPATISIQAVTKDGTTQPVDLNNVFDQIDVSLNLRPNDQTVTQVDVLVDGEIAASQMFSAADLALMAEENPEAADIQVITLSFNTARYDVDTDTYTATARYENGPRVIGAQVHVAEAELPTAANVIEVVFNNANTFHVLASRDGLDTELDASQLLWYGGPDFSLTVYPIPVMYNGQVVTSMTSGLRNETGDGLATGDGLGNCSVSTDNAAPFSFTWTCVGKEATGFLPVVTATVTDAGENGPVTGFGAALNIANVANTVDHPFPMRIDVRAPQGGSIVIVQQSSILNVGNWVNDLYSFTQSGAYTAPTDAGVGGVSRVRTEVIDLLGGSAVVWNSETGVNDLDETVTNEQYRVRALVQDALGNGRTISQSGNSPHHPETTFGYDATAPVVEFSDVPAEVGSLVDRYTIFENFSGGDPSDNVRAVATDNLAGFSATTGVSHSLIWVRGAFEGEGAIQTGRIVTASGSPTIVSTPFAAAADGDRVVTPVLVTAPNVDYVLQTKVDVAVNDLGTVIASAMGESVPPARYYIYQIEVRDQAGNVIRDYRAMYVNNSSQPVVQNLSNPASFDATAAFMASLARDSVEVFEGSLELRYPNTGGTIVWERPTADIVSALRMNAGLPDGVLFNDVIYRPANDVTFPLGFDALGLPFLKSVQTVDAGDLPLAKPDSVRVRVFNGFGADQDAWNHSAAPFTGGSGFSALISNTIQAEEIADPTTLYHTLPITSYEIVRASDPGVEDCDAQYCVRAIGPLSTFTNPFEGGAMLVAWAQSNASGDYSGVNGEVQWRVATIATPNFNHPFPTRDSGADRLYEWEFNLPAGVPTERLDLAAIGVHATTGDGLLTARMFVPSFNVVFSAASYQATVGGAAVTMGLVHGMNSTGGAFDVDECVFLNADGTPRFFPPTGMTVVPGAQSCIVTAGATAEAGEYMVRGTASQGSDVDTAVTQVVVVAPAFGITLAGAGSVDVPLAAAGATDYDFTVAPVGASGPISDLLCSISPTSAGVTVAPVDLGGGSWVCRVTVQPGEAVDTYTITAVAQEDVTGAEATDTHTFSTVVTWDVWITPDPATLSWSAATSLTVNYLDYVVGDVVGGISCTVDGPGLTATVISDGQCDIAVGDYTTAVAGSYTVTVAGTFGAPDSFARTSTVVLPARPIFNPEVDIQTAPDDRREIERDRTANFVVVDGEGLGIEISTTPLTPAAGESAAVVSPSDGGVTGQVIQDTDDTYVVQVIVGAAADTGNYTVTVSYYEEVSGALVTKELYIRVIDSGAQAPGGVGG